MLHSQVTVSCLPPSADRLWWTNLPEMAKIGLGYAGGILKWVSIIYAIWRENKYCLWENAHLVFFSYYCISHFQSFFFYSLSSDQNSTGLMLVNIFDKLHSNICSDIISRLFTIVKCGMEGAKIKGYSNCFRRDIDNEWMTRYATIV